MKPSKNQTNEDIVLILNYFDFHLTGITQVSSHHQQIQLALWISAQADA